MAPLHGARQPSDVGPGQLSLSHGAALQPDELHNVIIDVAGRSRLEVICFSSCNVLRYDDHGEREQHAPCWCSCRATHSLSRTGQRQWVRELGQRWHVIGFRTRTLATPGGGILQGVYSALLKDPAQVNDAFRHGWMTGVSVANASVEGTSFVIGDPAPSEGESCVFRNPSGEESYGGSPSGASF